MSNELYCILNFIPGFVMNNCCEIFQVSVFLLTLELRKYLLLGGWNKHRIGGGKLC